MLKQSDFLWVLRGNSGKNLARKSRNSFGVNSQGCGCIGKVDFRLKYAQSWNQIQTLKECLSCHKYCTQFEPCWTTIVTASRVVSLCTFSPFGVQSCKGSPGTLPPPNNRGARLAIRLVQWLGWVCENKERTKKWITAPTGLFACCQP